MTKILWITGAGKGIGRAVAWDYASRGWVVAVSARSSSDLKVLSEEARAAGLLGTIHPYVLDVTDEEAVVHTSRAVESDLGPLDQAILCAGIYVPNRPMDFDSALFRSHLEVNFLGCVNVLVAILPNLITRGCGHIGVVSSVAGYSGLPNASAYGATKAALINMCESLKTELDGLGVGISVINPGFVRTPLTDKNDFSMPFLMEAKDAARCIYLGMEKGKFEIAFPTIFVMLLKFLRILPYALYFPLVKKVMLR